MHLLEGLLQGAGYEALHSGFLREEQDAQEVRGEA